MTEQRLSDSDSREVAGCSCASGPVFLIGLGHGRDEPSLSWADEILLWKTDAMQLCREMKKAVLKLRNWFPPLSKEQSDAASADFVKTYDLCISPDKTHQFASIVSVS